METKQTAVEWLFEKITQNGEIRWRGTQYVKLFEQAKAMEKKQIVDAWENGFMSTGEGWNGEIPPDCQGEILDTEEYYNETYGKE
jgi:hypothetical protein